MLGQLMIAHFKSEISDEMIFSNNFAICAKYLSKIWG